MEMGSFARSSRRSMTFQKNVLGMELPEPCISIAAETLLVVVRARARSTIGRIRRANLTVLARGSRRRAARGETTLANVSEVDAMM